MSNDIDSEATRLYVGQASGSGRISGPGGVRRMFLGAVSQHRRIVHCGQSHPEKWIPSSGVTLTSGEQRHIKSSRP